ncbi:MAG: hypothetical protein ACRDP6_08480 [Actinoallomurus sp.]
MSRFRYAAAFTLIALAGCGSHGGGKAATSSAANAQDAGVKFAQCMRQHGVDMADPKPGDRGVRITGKKLDDAKVNTAMQACRKYSPMKAIDPNDPKTRDQMLKVAQCLREHGVQVADPQPGQAFRIQMKKGDTKTQQAMESCRKLVPPPGEATPRANG